MDELAALPDDEEAFLFRGKEVMTSALAVPALLITALGYCAGAGECGMRAGVWEVRLDGDVGIRDM